MRQTESSHGRVNAVGSKLDVLATCARPNWPVVVNRMPIRTNIPNPHTDRLAINILSLVPGHVKSLVTCLKKHPRARCDEAGFMLGVAEVVVVECHEHIIIQESTMLGVGLAIWNSHLAFLAVNLVVPSQKRVHPATICALRKCSPVLAIAPTNWVSNHEGHYLGRVSCGLPCPLEAHLCICELIIDHYGLFVSFHGIPAHQPSLHCHTLALRLV
mmetsp:Transcript_1063/g.2421  ORF Transcript_1063/g.2421 Transcript_1063/m.2421 type:complete len:215 (+) Transcript_1063:3074-3718(+)